MEIILHVIFFALMYAIKGGSGDMLFRNWNRTRNKNNILERLMDGKVLSIICVSLYAFFLTRDIYLSALIASGWGLAIAPSMGEEHGAVGRIGHSWGEYIDKGFGRTYGVKKAIQRGVWGGAILAVVTNYVGFIYFSMLFVPCVFIGQEINYRIYKQDGWRLAEPIIGGIVYGIPFGLYFIR